MAFSAATSPDHSYKREITDGIKELVFLAECLPYAEADQRKHEEMQRHGKCALEKMEAAKEALEAQKSASCCQTGNQLEKKRELRDEKKENERKLCQLEIQKNHQKQVHFLLQEKLSQAEYHLDDLLALQKKARKEEKCSKILTTVSLALLPLCSLLFSIKFFQEALKLTDTKELFASAAVLTTIFQVSMYVSQKAVLELQTIINKYKVQVFDYRQEKYKCEKDTREIEEKIKEIEESLENIKGRFCEITESSEAKNQFTDELYNCLQFVCNLTQKINAVVSRLDDPSDFNSARLHLDRIHQLVLSEIGKGEQGSLGFLDSKKVEIEKLKHSSKA